MPRSAGREGPVRRRRWAWWTLALLLTVVVVYGLMVEPHWIKVTQLNVAIQPTNRIVHFSDIHYRGNRRRLAQIVDLINEQQPGLVCFTGDLVSNRRYAAEAVEILRGLNAPLYAVPGNWDYHSGFDFSLMEKLCTTTGGKWLRDEAAAFDDELLIVGAEGQDARWIPPADSRRRLMLVHYPAFADRLEGERFDLILAGHSHGGQVRLPLIGSIVVPFDVGRYDLGLFETPAGQLYVTSGIGTSVLPFRLGCRPEITVIEF